LVSYIKILNVFAANGAILDEEPKQQARAAAYLNNRKAPTPKRARVFQVKSTQG